MKTSENGILEEVTKLPKELRNLVAGGIAGMTAKTVVAPFDRIKILYQISSAEFHIHKVPGVAAKIIRDEGFGALWKGNIATMIRVFPYSGIQFMVFDRCKTFLLREQEMNYLTKKSKDPSTSKPKWGLSPLQSLSSGMLAGAMSVCATYPLDLTRCQLAVLRRKKDASNLKFFQVIKFNYSSRVSTLSLQTLCLLHPESCMFSFFLHPSPLQGLPGLFRGITPTMLGILPYSGIAFAVNEQGKRKVGD